MFDYSCISKPWAITWGLRSLETNDSTGRSRDGAEDETILAVRQRCFYPPRVSVGMQLNTLERVSVYCYKGRVAPQDEDMEARRAV